VEEVDNMSKTLKSALAVLKLAIDIGHNVPFDGGAVGIRSENELNFEVGSRLIKKCEASGIKVIDCAPKNVKSHFDSLNKRVVAANNGGADFFISIHHNACLGGYGTEILCYPEERSEGVAKIILPEIVSLGYRNRGVKPRKELFVLSETKMPAILIECAFCDSEIDMKNYDAEKMAEAIFRGICKAFNITANDKEKHSDDEAKGEDECGVYHTVVKGDTLWALTKKYGVTLQRIIELNNIKDANLIYPGQKLRMK
jgi:N-acetylmuramoyl-L-alanine amidase